MNIWQYKAGAKVEIPLLQGHVLAGFPSPAEDYVDQKLDLNDFIVKHPESTYFVKVSGNSMIGAGIFAGDMLVVDRYIAACSGQIVLAVLDGEFTVKRYIKKGNVVVLEPDNPKYQKITLQEGQELTIWGVVIKVLHDPV